MIKDLEARMIKCLTLLRQSLVLPQNLEKRKSFRSIPLNAPVEVYDVFSYAENIETIDDVDFKKLFTFSDEEFEADFVKDKRHCFSATYFLEFACSPSVLSIKRGYSSGALSLKKHSLDSAYVESLIFKNIGGVFEAVYSSISGGTPFNAFIAREWPNGNLEFPGDNDIMSLYSKRDILRIFVSTVENTFERKFGLPLAKPLKIDLTSYE